MSALNGDADFEELFGSEQEHRVEQVRMEQQEKRLEAECVAGTRQRCKCGAPSLFTDAVQGPLCAPCGYDYAN